MLRRNFFDEMQFPLLIGKQLCTIQRVELQIPVSLLRGIVLLTFVFLLVRALAALCHIFLPLFFLALWEYSEKIPHSFQ